MSESSLVSAVLCAQYSVTFIEGGLTDQTVSTQHGPHSIRNTQRSPQSVMALPVITSIARNY